MHYCSILCPSHFSIQFEVTRVTFHLMIQTFTACVYGCTGMSTFCCLIGCISCFFCFTLTSIFNVIMYYRSLDRQSVLLQGFLGCTYFFSALYFLFLFFFSFSCQIHPVTRMLMMMMMTRQHVVCCSQCTCSYIHRRL